MRVGGRRGGGGGGQGGGALAARWSAQCIRNVEELDPVLGRLRCSAIFLTVRYIRIVAEGPLSVGTKAAARQAEPSLSSSGSLFLDRDVGANIIARPSFPGIT